MTKKWGEKSAKQFFQKHTNSAIKKVGKKIVGKKCKNVFLYSHEYRDQKMGGQNEQNNFSRHKRIVGAKNIGKKNRLIKVRKKRFLYSHEYPDKKMGGKKTRERLFPETHE